mmetsp:Transcript_15218/g.25266  ORF Transcript_15218/g.25266 Transcript_15218/m.25266 type:complete len:601 (+) Transcript_15218:90-1892(+)
MATKKKGANALTNEILKYETGLDKDPENFQHYGQLIELLLRDGNIARAKILLEQGREVNKKHNIGVESRYNFACSCVSVWRTDRYTRRDTVRLNTSDERKEMLYGAEDVLIALANGDASTGPFQQRVMAKLAHVKECLGLHAESLALLSELITMEADTGVELAYIIFKAAVILEHMGETAQAIEYLEFLQEDPPTTEGIGLTHVLGYLALCFENKGSIYLVALEGTYGPLQEAYLADIAKANPAAVYDVEKKFTKKSIKESSDVWETLGLQALERCEMTMAFGLLHLASKKAPGKAALLHSCAELEQMFGRKDEALAYAKKAYKLQSTNADLRNLMLTLDPDSMRDKLRTAAKTRHANISEEEEDKRIAAMGGGQSRLKHMAEDTDSGKGDAWLLRRHKANKEGEHDEKALEHARTGETTESEKQAALQDERKKIEEERRRKKKEKKKKAKEEAARKEGGKKKKKKKKAATSDDEDASKDVAAGPLNKYMTQNRPLRPKDITPDMRRHINFALRGNKNIHMYDPTLKLVQAVRNPNPPKVMPVASPVKQPPKEQTSEVEEQKSDGVEENKEEVGGERKQDQEKDLDQDKGALQQATGDPV